jgi:hypothetical protein
MLQIYPSLLFRSLCEAASEELTRCRAPAPFQERRLRETHGYLHARFKPWPFCVRTTVLGSASCSIVKRCVDHAMLRRVPPDNGFDTTTGIILLGWVNRTYGLASLLSILQRSGAETERRSRIASRIRPVTYATRLCPLSLRP